jgi:hypothetical protein
LDGTACEIDGNPFGIAEAPLEASASTPKAAAAASVCLRCVMRQFLLLFSSRRPNQRRTVENVRTEPAACHSKLNTDDFHERSFSKVARIDAAAVTRARSQRTACQSHVSGALDVSFV